MSEIFLSGAYTALGLHHLIWGVYFLLILGRRGGAYALFGVTSITYALAAALLGQFSQAVLWSEKVEALASVAPILLLAAALHLHFILSYLHYRWVRVGAMAAYGGAALLFAVSYNLQWAFASSLVFVGLSLVLSFALLLGSNRGGRMDLLALTCAIGAMAPFLVHDTISAINEPVRMVIQLPLAFVCYPPAVVATLLFGSGVARMKLEHAKRNFQQRTRSLQRARAELKALQADLSNRQQLAVLGELSAVIARSVRSPVAVIGDAASNLRNCWDDGRQRKTLLSIIDDEAAHLDQLVVELLRFSEPIRRQLVAVDTPQLADFVRGMLGAEREFDVELSRGEPKLTLSVDGDLLQMVLRSVVDNAFHQLPKRSRLRADVGTEASGGKGMPAGGKQTLWICISLPRHSRHAGAAARYARGARMHAPRRPDLGLEIAERVLEAYGGNLTIESSDGLPTAVVVRVPSISSVPFCTNGATRHGDGLKVELMST